MQRECSDDAVRRSINNFWLSRETESRRKRRTKPEGCWLGGGDGSIDPSLTDAEVGRGHKANGVYGTNGLVSAFRTSSELQM